MEWLIHLFRELKHNWYIKNKMSNMTAVGSHLIIDINHINIYDTDKLKYIDSVFPIMDDIVHTCNFTVIGKSYHQFTPIGVTCVYLLSESHISIHTYPELNSCYMDIFCCSSNFNVYTVLNILKHTFNGCNINHTLIVRGQKTSINDI